MGIKNFHIFFIVTSLALLVFLLWWGGGRILAGQNGASWVLAISALVGLAAGLPYIVWFIRKSKHL